ncbi:MAG TPA: AAA family ATPase, partial [Polyangiaceae bacterium]|nr:AAA family ATPase [Polyangiaceae bacterium]
MPIQFGNFELDEVRLELRRCGTLVDTQPRAVKTLLYLVTNRDRLVTKDEILAILWKGTSVSEAALSQVIHQLRAALGDDPKAPRFIATVRGKGFRQLETERLRLAANEARAGHGNVVLIHGPPGVGKTRLAQWFATHQREAGAEVCWGGCREGQSAPPFWPWPEVLHRYTETRDRAAIEGLADGLEQDLVAVAPELRETLTVAPVSAPDESYERAQSVLEAIATFLRRAASRAPVTLVLEDLHLADDAALHLFEVIARSIADTELTILGTCRRTEGSARGVLRAALEGSLPTVRPLALDGLSLDDVRTWLATVSPTPLPDSTVEAVHFSTEGLPLFLEALVHELPTEGSSLLTGDGNQAVSMRGRTKDILGRRLHQLDDSTLQLLRTAAVFGEEFPTAILAAVTRKPLDVLLRRLDLAQGHGVLKAATEGSLRFAHALHQELLYHELSALERHEQHAAFARALADQLAQDPDAIVQTAHHFLEALPDTDPSDAVHYARKAAEWARARHAYARAAQYYQRALDVLDTGSADPRQYAELLLALGQTQCVAGSVEDAIATLERVFELTRALCHYDLFCRAILIWFQLRQDTAAIDPVFHARIAEALQNVREKDAVFAQLQVARAMSQMFTSPMSERVLWIQEALALTRETANSRTRLDVLRGVQRCHTRFTDGTTELGVAQELLQLAIALRSPEAELEARQSRANTLLEFGRGIEFAHEVTACRQRAMDV